MCLGTSLWHIPSLWWLLICGALGLGGCEDRQGAGTLAQLPLWHECAPMHTLGITDPGQAHGFRLCFRPQCSWNLLCPSHRDGLAPNGLRGQLVKVTLAVCTFELFIPSRVLVIRRYLFGGACSDMAQEKYLPRAMDRRFLVHLTDTPTPCKRQGWARQLPSRAFHSPLAGRASSRDVGLSLCWSSVTHASTEALIIAPYLSLQTFCALTGRVCHCGALPVLVGL